MTCFEGFSELTSTELHKNLNQKFHKECKQHSLATYFRALGLDKLELFLATFNVIASREEFLVMLFSGLFVLLHEGIASLVTRLVNVEQFSNLVQRLGEEGQLTRKLIATTGLKQWQRRVITQSERFAAVGFRCECYCLD